MRTLGNVISGLVVASSILASASYAKPSPQQTALSFENQTNFRSILFAVQNHPSGQFCMLNSEMPLKVQRESRVIIRTQEPANCVQQTRSVYFIRPDGIKIFCYIADKDQSKDISWMHFRAVSDDRCELDA